MADDSGYSFKKDDKTPVILIGVLVLLIVLLGAALVFLVSQKPEEPPPESVLPNETAVPTYPNETEPEGQENATTECGDECYYNIAMDDINHTACAMIENGTLEQECYGQLSDVSLEACLALENESRRHECVTDFAVEFSDLSICDYLNETREECRLEMDPCLNAEDKELCYALEYDDPSECDSDTKCLLNYSIAKGDSEACSLIQNPVVVQACISSITRNDKCYVLDTVSQQDYCYQLYSVYSDNYYHCNEITPNTVYAIECYSYFAAKENDLSICGEDGFSLDTLWDCYTNFSLLSGNISGCEAIHELATTSRFACAFDFAKKYGDPSACMVIQSLPKRSTCYEGVILYWDNPINWTKCEDITNFNWRNKCYTESAKIHDDVSICDYIDVSYAEEACRIAYEANKSKSE
ncbi:hypothetical protein GF318_02525 [Candidatus Micrarchaeota archaeon]|nr:hypothetical protein [Candidatus Micrarchaeota archaeon]